MDHRTLPAPPRRVAPFVLAALAFALYVPTLGNDLTNWDDPRYVAGNPFATQGLAGILAAFTQQWDDAWYPLTHAVYSVIQAVAGTSAFAHHLVQASIFAGAVALVPAALAAFGVPVAVGFWAALFFAAHPLRVESVSWVANLKDTLSLLGVVASFALYGSGRRIPSALAFAAGLLAKSTVAPVALVFVLLEAREHGFGRSLKRGLPWLVPAVAVAAVAAWFHVLHPELPGRSVPGGGLLAAIPSVLWLPWWYVGRMLLPMPSQAIYAFEAVGLLDLRFFAALALWGGAVALALKFREKGLVALGAFALPFAAVTGLVPLLFPVADRYALLPSLAVAAIVIALAAPLADGRRSRLFAAGLGSVLVGGLAFASVQRQAEWHDSLTLWQADVARDPSVVEARLNLAAALGDERRWDEVEEHAKAALAIDPDRTLALRHLFTAQAMRAGMGLGQVITIGEGIESFGTMPEALVTAAGAALRARAYDAALTVANAALEREGRVDAHVVAAQALAMLGRHDDALTHAQEASKLSPNAGLPRVLQARALVALGKLELALVAARSAVGDPATTEVAKALQASILLQLGRADEAAAVVPHLPKVPVPTAANP